jgi:hypothetical protein
VEQAEQAKAEADAEAEASEAQAHNFESGASSATANGDSDTSEKKVYGVAVATLLFVLLTIGLLVAMQIYYTRNLAEQQLTVSAMPLSVQEDAGGRLSVTDIPRGRTDTEVYSERSASRHSLQRTPNGSAFQNPAYDGPGPVANGMAGDAAPPSHAPYQLATAVNLPGQSPTETENSRPSATSFDDLVSRGASIVSRPSPNGGAPTLAYQLATGDDDFEQVSAGLGDRSSQRSRRETMQLDAAANSPSGVSDDHDSRDRVATKWGSVRSAIHATSQFTRSSDSTSPTRRLSHVTNM